MSHQSRSFIQLPEELQSNIFLRLPVKCLLICKCVCKSFCTIIQNPDFTNAHLTCPKPITTETSRSLMLGLIDTTRVPSVQCHNNLLSIDNTGDIICSSPLTPSIPYVGALLLVGSCNGLICFDVRTDRFTSESNFLLWNPVTRQTRYLPRLENRSKCECDSPRTGLGLENPSKCDSPHTEFGFVKEINDYMVVNVLKSYDDYNIHIELYKMSTNSWTVCCNTTVGQLIPSSGRRFALDQEATSLYSNGCFHWGTRYSNGAYILSFNLINEELGIIKGVDHDRESYFNRWKLAVIEEDLAMIYWKFTDEFQIWVMTDYGVEGSWVLKFDFGGYISSLYPVGYWKYDMMIIVLETHYYLFNLNDGEPERIPDMRSCIIGKICSFEESFAPVRRLH